MDMIISSLQNPRIKSLARYNNRRHRDEEQKILVEGYRGLLRALNNGFRVEELFTCPELFLGENEGELIERARAQGAQVVQVPPEVFRKITYRDRPEGLLALLPQFHLTPADLPKNAHPFFVIGQAIEKPGNLGTMLRSADAAGCDGFIVCDACTDIFNPNVVCASVGTLFTMPIAEAGSQDCIDWCKREGIRIVAATPHTSNIFTDVDLSSHVAIAMGTEQHGLSQLWLDQADLQVRIPMFGQADSLNVATATTLLLFEAVRQRRARGIIPPDRHQEHAD